VETWTIEVTDTSAAPAQRWKDAYGEGLVRTALAQGATKSTWVAAGDGVVLELAFADEGDWLRFRATPPARAALTNAAKPPEGFLIFTGRREDDTRRAPEPVLASVVVRYLRQWYRWSLRTYLKWSLTGEQGWWLVYQTENTIDRLEWLADHGLTVRGRSRRGGDSYQLAPGVPLAQVWQAVATGCITAPPVGPR
jgi:hypothetical protein